ncbi:hypothetical protein NPX13_g5801 [Xylaria arbuscula]|uniref:DUF7770 domain-containing protein n=1 Tax=Xylaria arbuscula TaxID=114810 RepID=A0A9W8TMD4_9PEZI|nr:hypothetical protein NPX13_g5801 [Xylaria arbuscula]
MDTYSGTDYLNTEHLKHQITNITVVAYRNQDNRGDGKLSPTNHWSIFLKTTENNSVRVEMAHGLGNDGLTGKVELLSKKYICTNNAIYTMSFQPIKTITVQDFIDLLTENKRQQYTFTPEFEGCSFWVYTIIGDLEAAGVVPAGSAESTWNAVSYYYVNPEGTVPREVRRGTFRP